MSLRRLEGSNRQSVIGVWFPKVDSKRTALKRYSKGVQAVYSGSRKLLVYGTGEMGLYDLASDPGEKNNLVPSSKAEVKQLAAALDHWLQTTPKFAGKGKQADEQMLERLKGLGYVQ